MKLFKKLVSFSLALCVAASMFTLIGNNAANAEIVSTVDRHLYSEMSFPYAYGIAIPKTYTVRTTIRTFASTVSAMCKNPQDMYIDDQDMIYVVDTGNNRVLKMDSYGEIQLDISKIRHKEHPDGDPKEKDENGKVIVCETCNQIKPEVFKNPSGIYVDSDHDMYIADTGNARIVHLDSEGYFVENFYKPTAKALEDYSFDVTKLYISKRGVIYVLCRTDFQGFMMISNKGEYLGNTGMTKTTSNFASFIWSKIISTGSEAVTQSMWYAPPYSNFIMDENDWVYATIINTGTDQIAKLNSSGTSVYPKGKYGRDFVEIIDNKTYDVQSFKSNFVDIAVDKDGIIYALDDSVGNVFLYDQDGNNLAYFGSLGTSGGKFKKPAAIGLLQDESVVVLDAGSGYITVFEPTEFCNLVRKGTTLYRNAEYEKARAVWEELLKIDTNYIFAHKAIARSYFKEKDYYAAMEEYKLAMYKKGYSEAFEKQKSAVTKEYFFLIALIVICVIIYAVIGYKKLKRYADKLHIKLTTWGGDL